MGYSDDDLGISPQEEQEITVWNAHTVYYDDEIVEYQGRYFIALNKTFAEVPGRCKPGIWKEIAYESIASVYRYDEEDYGEELYEQNDMSSSVEEKQPAKPKATPQKTAQPVKPAAVKKTLAQQKEEKAQTATPSKSAPQPLRRDMQLQPTDQSLVNEALKAMDFKKIKGFNSDENSITGKLILPQTGKDGLIFTWESSHPQYISAKGEVIRPKDGEDVAVNLGLTVTLNQAKATRFFTLWVKAEEKVYTDQESVDLVYDNLTFKQILGANTDAARIDKDLPLVSSALHNTAIYWASSERSVVDESGSVYRTSISKATPVRLYAIIVKGSCERMKTFDITVIP